MTGYVHSIESFGTVDGPGVRLVIFLKGCPLRCLYCHNPDTWDMAGGAPMTVNDILKQYQSARHFYRQGGITVTGGEPLLQINFVTELFEAAHELGIHTCLDTSGATFDPEDPDSISKMDHLISATDLVILDIKHIEPNEHQKLCGISNKSVLEFARYLDKQPVTLWIRHVAVPGITYDDKWLYQLGRFIGSLRHVKALDVLPYHTMGAEKYKHLGMQVPLEGVPPLSREEAVQARNMILKGIQDKRKDLFSDS